MIELKAGVIRTPHDEGMSFELNSDHVSVTEGETEFYLKSEADKLIAELNMRICDGDEDFEIANNQIERLLKIVRHQKYKRCLAITRWCFTKSNYHFVVGRSEGGKTGMTHYRISRLYSKWYKRWLKIAEQFKEDK